MEKIALTRALLEAAWLKISCIFDDAIVKKYVSTHNVNAILTNL